MELWEVVVVIVLIALAVIITSHMMRQQQTAMMRELTAAVEKASRAATTPAPTPAPVPQVEARVVNVSTREAPVATHRVAPSERTVEPVVTAAPSVPPVGSKSPPTTTHKLERSTSSPAVARGKQPDPTAETDMAGKASPGTSAPRLQRQPSMKPSPKPPAATRKVAYSFSVTDETSGKKVVPNVGQPFVVENEFFSGLGLFKMRMDPPEPVFERYFSMYPKRQFEIQLQFKFKVLPKGPLLIGGEVPQPMNLGILLKGMARALMNIVKMMQSGLHWSFGDPSVNELPHVAFPLYMGADTLTSTPPGQTPPTLGVDEAPNTRIGKNSEAPPGYYNLEDTYTLSFFSSNLNFMSWKAVNIPKMRDVDLHSFWGKMPIRLVAYSLREGAETKVHRMEDKQYFFCFSIQPLDDMEVLEVADGDVNPQVLDETFLEEEQPVESAAAPVEDLLIDRTADAYADEPEERGSRSHSSSSDSSDENRPESAVAGTSSSAQPPRKKTPPQRLVVTPRLLAEDEAAPGDVAADVPAWFERTLPGTSRREIVHLLTVSSHGTTSSRIAHYRDFKDIQRSLEMHKSQARIAGGKRIQLSGNGVGERRSSSAAEAERERLCQFVNEIVHDPLLEPEQKTRLLHLQSPDTPPLFQFHSRSEYHVTLPAKSAPVVLEGTVLRALWETHWVEEWAVLHNASLNFFKQGSKKPLLTVPIESIVDVADFDMAEMPLVDLPVLMVETPERVIYLATPSTTVRERWRVALNSAKERHRRSAGSDDESDLLATKTMTTGPRVLNIRRMYFKRARRACSSPLDVTATLLRMVLRLTPDSPREDVSRFLDATTELKGVRLDLIPEPENVAFFLNLYHTLLLHALLLFGPPSSLRNQKSFFSTFMYEVGGHVISLVELEHCILRAPMSPPDVPYAVKKLILPNKFAPSDPRTALKLQQPERRINFVLNSGNRSCLNKIPVFTPGDIDKQFDEASGVFLNSLITVDETKRSIQLPKVMEWYRNDFQPSKTELVRYLLRFLTGTQWKVVSRLLADGDAIVLKYAPYEWDMHLGFEEMALDRVSARDETASAAAGAVPFAT